MEAKSLDGFLKGFPEFSVVQQDFSKHCVEVDNFVSSICQNTFEPREHLVMKNKNTSFLTWIAKRR